MSGLLGLNEPTAASFRVTHYDAQGYAKTEERALVAYADMEPVKITSDPAASIERMEYGYFHSGVEPAKKTSLRDTVYLSGEKGIELSETAPWKARSLVIDSPNQLKGQVTGSAWMEHDGLHVSVTNGTDAVLQGAYIFTSLGYTSVGDIGCGEEKQIVIAREENPLIKEDGAQAILDGVLLEYPVSLYTVTDASVYVQQESDPEFDESDLPEAERQALSVEVTKRSFSSSSLDEQLMPCVLYAQTPDLSCVQLYKDGAPIERSAQESILTAQIPFSVQSESGYAYYPKGTFKAHAASLQEGVPNIGKAVEKWWYSDVSEDRYFAFDFSQISGTDIELVRIVSEARLTEDEMMVVEIYDTELKEFVKMPEPGSCTLSGDLLRRAIDSQGQLFIRYAAVQEHSGSMYAPEVIVEGSVRL